MHMTYIRENCVKYGNGVLHLWFGFAFYLVSCVSYSLHNKMTTGEAGSLSNV